MSRRPRVQVDSGPIDVPALNKLSFKLGSLYLADNVDSIGAPNDDEDVMVDAEKDVDVSVLRDPAVKKKASDALTSIKWFAKGQTPQTAQNLMTATYLLQDTLIGQAEERLLRRRRTEFALAVNRAKTHNVDGKEQNYPLLPVFDLRNYPAVASASHLRAPYLASCLAKVGESFPVDTIDNSNPNFALKAGIEESRTRFAEFVLNVNMSQSDATEPLPSEPDYSMPFETVDNILLFGKIDKVVNMDRTKLITSMDEKFVDNDNLLGSVERRCLWYHLRIQWLMMLKSLTDTVDKTLKTQEDPAITFLRSTNDKGTKWIDVVKDLLTASVTSELTQDIAKYYWTLMRAVFVVRPAVEVTQAMKDAHLRLRPSESTFESDITTEPSFEEWETVSKDADEQEYDKAIQWLKTLVRMSLYSGVSSKGAQYSWFGTSAICLYSLQCCIDSIKVNPTQDALDSEQLNKDLFEAMDARKQEMTSKDASSSHEDVTGTSQPVQPTQPQTTNPSPSPRPPSGAPSPAPPSGGKSPQKRGGKSPQPKPRDEQRLDDDADDDDDDDPKPDKPPVLATVKQGVSYLVGNQFKRISSRGPSRAETRLQSALTPSMADLDIDAMEKESLPTSNGVAYSPPLEADLGALNEMARCNVAAQVVEEYSETARQRLEEYKMKYDQLEIEKNAIMATTEKMLRKSKAKATEKESELQKQLQEMKDALEESFEQNKAMQENADEAMEVTTSLQEELETQVQEVQKKNDELDALRAESEDALDKVIEAEGDVADLRQTVQDNEAQIAADRQILKKSLQRRKVLRRDNIKLQKQIQELSDKDKRDKEIREKASEDKIRMHKIIENTKRIRNKAMTDSEIEARKFKEAEAKATRLFDQAQQMEKDAQKKRQDQAAAAEQRAKRAREDYQRKQTESTRKRADEAEKAKQDLAKRQQAEVERANKAKEALEKNRQAQADLLQQKMQEAADRRESEKIDKDKEVQVAKANAETIRLQVEEARESAAKAKAELESAESKRKTEEAKQRGQTQRKQAEENRKAKVQEAKVKKDSAVEVQRERNDGAVQLQKERNDGAVQLQKERNAGAYKLQLLKTYQALETKRMEIEQAKIAADQKVDVAVIAAKGKYLMELAKERAKKREALAKENAELVKATATIRVAMIKVGKQMDTSSRIGGLISFATMLGGSSVTALRVILGIPTYPVFAASVNAVRIYAQSGNPGAAGLTFVVSLLGTQILSMWAREEQESTIGRIKRTGIALFIGLLFTSPSTFFDIGARAVEFFRDHVSVSTTVSRMLPEWVVVPGTVVSVSFAAWFAGATSGLSGAVGYLMLLQETWDFLRALYYEMDYGSITDLTNSLSEVYRSAGAVSLYSLVVANPLLSAVVTASALALMYGLYRNRIQIAERGEDLMQQAREMALDTVIQKAESAKRKRDESNDGSAGSTDDEPDDFPNFQRYRDKKPVLGNIDTDILVSKAFYDARPALAQMAFAHVSLLIMVHSPLL